MLNQRAFLRCHKWSCYRVMLVEGPATCVCHSTATSSTRSLWRAWRVSSMSRSSRRFSKAWIPNVDPSLPQYQPPRVKRVEEAPERVTNSDSEQRLSFLEAFRKAWDLDLHKWRSLETLVFDIEMGIMVSIFIRAATIRNDQCLIPQICATSSKKCCASMIITWKLQ